MRKDMAKVIVTRPRILDSMVRKGRAIPDELQPKSIGLRRHARERGGWKMLNETLTPLRRYLEAQVGRSWNAVYSEIAANLRPTSTVQQHVRDHLADFVNLHRQPSGYGRYGGGLWYEPLYVDAHGILRRTDDLPEARAARLRRRVRRPDTAQAPIRLAPHCELRRIGGVWYEVRLAPLPEPEYRAVVRSVKQRIRPYDTASPMRTMEVRVHQLVTPAVQDAVTGEAVLAGPESDDHDSWKRYRQDRPARVYAVAKRQLSRRELRRHGLSNTEVKLS
ncbi:hypothetical protein JIX58_10415 [Brevundimonas diminuta]|uniref:hypothetical protein n=1 Tax=Brevundimonas TaxID=41275 RepID=UPI0019035756|nr:MULTISPECIES: hypothetical protein [Brevundimonas]MBK1976157.1 hypothetical protein [Brevundimonas diminuta]